jgi:tubulin-specific chaperone A
MLKFPSLINIIPPKCSTSHFVTNAIHRLVKEAAYYVDEVHENETKLEQMKNNNDDKYDIKKFQEVLAESHMMIPDSINRRDNALVDLKEYVSLLKKEEGGNVEVMECEWMNEANKILGESGLVDDTACKGEDREGDDVAVLTAVDDLAEGEEF